VGASVLIEILKAFILGLVQGATEFIPVSSTGHLIIFSHFLGFTGPLAKTFDIVVQLGSILAIVYLYFEVLRSPRIWSRIIVGILPILVVGFLFEKKIKHYLFNPLTVTLALFIFGVVMIWVDRRKNRESISDLFKIGYAPAFMIGLIQCLALWPGVSRSGATIVGGLLMGLTYAAAAQFSFVLAVPVMVIATAYEFIKEFSSFTMADLGVLAVGLVTAFIFAVISVRTFMRWLNQLKLLPFGVYRIVLAAVLLILIYFKVL